MPSLPPAHDLQAEYISLFVNNKGFVPAVPYASYYKNGGRLMGDSLFILRQKMAETGFQIDPSVPELEDHLTILLEYASDLIASIVEKYKGMAEIRIEFDTLLEVTDNYIRPVVLAVTEKIEEYGTLDFYRIAAKTLNTFIEDTSSVYESLFDLE